MPSELNCRVILGIIIALFLFVAEGINYSQLAPFFPNEAELRKDLSEFAVGVINSVFDFANLIFSASLPLFAKPELNKFLFVSGTSFGAVSNICFGVLGNGPGGWWFASMCFFCRVVMGMGAAMLWATGVPMLTSMAPSYAGRIASLIESGVGVGIALGPPIGSLVFSLGGYMYPFLVSGSIELVFVFIAMACIPTSPAASRRATVLKDDEAINNCDDYALEDSDNEHSDVKLLNPKEAPSGSSSGGSSSSNSNDEDSTGEAFAKYLSYPGVWLVSLFFLTASVPFGLFDVALSPFLLDTFNIDGDTAGLYFLSMGALYAIFTQFVGHAVDKGLGAYIFFWSCIATVFVSFLFSVPWWFPAIESKVYIGSILALDGIALSGTFVPVYFLLQEIARTSGFMYGEDRLQLVVGIWINFVMSAGRIIGSCVFGGLIYPKIGFYEASFITSVLFLFSTILSNGYLISSHNYRRIYFKAPPIEDTSQRSDE